MNLLREFTVAEFRGDFPEIQIDPRVNLDALTKGDEDPFFVTLPVARVGATSINGLEYDEALVRAIETQAVGKGGIMGHISMEERDTAFPIEDADWVGVLRQGGTLWGKAYVPPGEAREYIRRLKARGGKLATSIYGPFQEKLPGNSAGSHRIRGLRLESLDLAPADRAALKLGGAFGITAQMETDNPEEGDDDMPTKDEIIAELTSKDVPQTLREQIVQEWQAKNDSAERIAELEQQVGDRDTVISELRDQLETVRVREFEAALDGVVAEFVKFEAKNEDGKKKVDSLRRMFRARVVAEIGDEREQEQVQETAKTLWADEFQVIAETIRDALAGPPARVNGKTGNSRQIEDTPEARAKARAEMGL